MNQDSGFYPRADGTPADTERAETSRVLEDVLASFSPRAREPLHRAWVLAAGHLGAPPHRIEILRETFRGIVLRFGAASGSVVIKHFRRRDAATNSGGFGYLRALHGSAALPGAAEVQFHDDDARLIAFTDYGDARGVAANHDALRAWLLAWPELVVGGLSPVAQEFSRRLAAADPDAGGPGRAGGFPSLGLLRKAGVPPDVIEWLTDPAPSILWAGDMNPENFVTLLDGSFRQLDLEGTCFCHPGLLVAEALRGLPSAPHHEVLRRALPRNEWREAARRLAEAWAVSDRDVHRGGLVLDAVHAELGDPR